ncbi:D-alanyl-D-alanine carboxypeptidase family protein [Streptomyces sp. NPDC018038]|uniref:D-alanyl-D-alanine carboxypeptidase family protein n=1 Tax=Streptomyces sp. NPDC018038 TaxID=3365036 RepID=UPI0037A9D116
MDQPTAVFKTLTPRTPEDDAPAQERPERQEEPREPETTEPAGKAAEAAEASEAESGAEKAPEPESDRLKAAVAAWVATAEEPEKAEAAERAGDGAEASAEAPAEASAKASDGSEASARASDGADGDVADADVAADEAGATDAGDADAARPDANDGETDGSDADSGARADSGSGAGADVDADSADSGSGSEAADDEPVAEKAAAAEKPAAESWFAARKPAADAKPADAEPADAAVPAVADADGTDRDDRTGSTGGDDRTDRAADGAVDADAAGAADDVEDKPVDQPTTMFKAVRPPVDQPTTALKLPSSLTGKGGSGRSAADADSERTSTFLPLRADIPADQKAERAARAAAATPKAPEAPKPAGAAPVPPKAPTAATASPAPAPALTEPERTRQQPLPPLPPLDLLAELTNTPPPPPTPLRTTVRRVRIWTPLILLVLIVFAIVQMVRPLPAPQLTLSAAPTFSFQGGDLKLPFPAEGQGAVEVEGVGSMGTYGAQKPAPIASVTKTMTAYVILRDHPLKGSQKGPEIEIDQKAADQGKAEHESTAAVQKGQTYSEKELLELLMIPSANNVARLLARWDAGSEAAFVEKMNAAAKDLGMTRSTYTDPSGLLDSTVSTPQDQLKLAKAVMQYDVFREIVNMPNVTVDGIPGRIENNNNILLEPGVSGIKTGSSTPAGGNLLWSANTIVDGQNRRILGIVMGAKDADQLGQKLQLAIDNSLKIIQQAQKDVTSAAVIRKGQVIGYVDDGLGGRTPVVATKELKAIGWPGLQVKLALTDGGKAVPHAGKAGDVVGQVSIGTGAGRVSSPVALQADLAEPGFDKKLTRVG